MTVSLPPTYINRKKLKYHYEKNRIKKALSVYQSDNNSLFLMRMFKGGDGG